MFISERYQRILAVGNPLLDMQVSVSREFLDKYQLVPDDAILADPKHLGLFDEIRSNETVEYVAGGSAQNSARVAQWVLKKYLSDKENDYILSEALVSYAGSVGDDYSADKMKQICQLAEVRCVYQVNKGASTGVCAVCISDHNRSRSMIANVGAAELFKDNFFYNNFDLLLDNDIFYVEGFFIASSPKSIKYLTEYIINERKVFALNISAPFIVQDPEYRKVFLEVYASADFLFGNEREFRALASSLNWNDTDDAEIMKKLIYRPKSGRQSRVLVMTRGSSSTVVCQKVADDVTVSKVPVVEVHSDHIVDTNGAGDAYVGGFLAAYSMKKTIPECCEIAADVASLVIKRSGCTLPECS